MVSNSKERTMKQNYFKNFIKSFLFFSPLVLVKRKYDVLFYYHSHLNRGENGENLYLEPMINSLKKHNISYLVLEKAYLGKGGKYHKRNKQAVPFDFITILQRILNIVLKPFYKNIDKEDFYNIKDAKITKILRTIFFRNLQFNICIYMPGGNGVFIKGINPDAVLLERQHGVIFNGHQRYLLDNKASSDITQLQAGLLVFGKGYQELLLEGDETHYFTKNNVIPIGMDNILDNNRNTTKENNKQILITLQFVSGLNIDDMLEMKRKLINILEVSQGYLESSGYKVILKHHPAYDTRNCPTINFDHPSVRFAKLTENISELLSTVALHVTFNSTSAFDAAKQSIPTCFIDNKVLPSEFFLNQYKYPLKYLLIKKPDDFVELLIQLENHKYYQDSSQVVRVWYDKFYHTYDENKFLNLLDFKKVENENN